MGIFVLLLVALINLFPPYAVGIIVDGVGKRNMTEVILFKWSLLLLSAALLVYGLRYAWRLTIFGASSRLGRHAELLLTEGLYHKMFMMQQGTL